MWKAILKPSPYMLGIYIQRKNKEAIDMINNVLSEYSDEKYSLYHASLYNVWYPLSGAVKYRRGFEMLQ